MVRARKSHKGDEETVSTKTHGLQPAYSGKVGGDRYVVYVDYKKDGEHTRTIVFMFSAKYAARWFIDRLIHTDTWEWCEDIGSRACIQTTFGLKISMFGKDLEVLMDYQMSTAEAEWSDPFVAKSVLRFKYGQSEFTDERQSVDDEQGDTDDSEPERQPPEKLPRKGRSDKAERPAREPKAPRADTSGHISANDIAKQLGVEGREVRGVLRGLKLEKPAHGWSWPKTEADKIKEQISAALKKAKTKGK